MDQATQVSKFIASVGIAGLVIPPVDIAMRSLHAWWLTSVVSSYQIFDADSQQKWGQTQLSFIHVHPLCR